MRYAGSVGYPAVAQSHYFIRSRLNGFVLDVEGENRNPGARVLMWKQKTGNADNQLWYDDFATGTIRSKLNDFCLDWNGTALPHCATITIIHMAGAKQNYL